MATLFMVSDPTTASGKSRQLSVENLSLDARLALQRARSRVLISLLQDLRTPLMMIKSPLEGSAMADHGIVADLLEHAERIQKGIERALEVLELDLLDDGERNVIHDLAGALDRYAASVAATTDRAGLTIEYASDIAQADVRVHEAKIQHLLDTLFQRAAELTPAGGTIEMRLTEARQEDRPAVVLTLVVRPESIRAADSNDHRAGIDPFVGNLPEPAADPRAASARSARSSPDMDLAIRHVVQCGGEFIETPDEWRVLLPAERVVRRETAQTEDPEVREDRGVQATEIQGDETILIIDDHPGTRAYLRYAFRKEYRVLEAGDGKAGLQMVREHRPDLVISDIMMPHLDGNELCRIIKSDDALKHIPVVLVTANSLPSVKARGLESGADDYLVKPIDVREARMRVRNIIRSRKELKQHFGRSLVIRPSEISVLSEDEALIKRATDIVERNMENGNFSVQELADELGMSARQLQRRLREIANQSPVEFMRHLRLQRAAQLLEKRYGNVSEVAYHVGFTSLSYFAKCFKEEFGESPSAFRER